MTATALVTGASSGIGRETARALRGIGHTVYAGARRVERMADLAADGIRPVRLDVTDDASMKAVVDRMIEETGRVNVLVNNAGYGAYGALEDVPIDEARRQFEVNVFGLARLTQLVLPHMRERRVGRIVNISSMGGKIYEPLGSWYHAAKHAVEGLSDALRLEVAPFGIHVVIVEPGAIATEWNGIAADGLMRASGGTAYADQARDVAALLTSTGAGPLHPSPPSVVAATVVRAVRAARPRTRYTVGAFARPMVSARRMLPDRAMDRLITAGVRRAAAHEQRPEHN